MFQPAPLPLSPFSARTPGDELLRLRAHLEAHCDMTLLETVPAMVLLLDSRRQVLHANAALLEYAGKRGAPLPMVQALGLRPGELFGCVHAAEAADGCGATWACGQCGVLRTLRGAAAGTMAEDEGRVLRRRDGRLAAVTIATRAVAMDFGGRPFFLLYLQDVRDRHTSKIMESLFLHDALNALNGVVGAAGMLHDELRGDQHELAGMVLERAGHLEHEIRSYRMLLDAERAELELHPEDVDPAALCSTLARLFTPQAQAAGVRLACAPGPNARLRTDKGILLRVLENLLKNAVEASPRGGTVTLGHESRGAGVRFFVSNESVMPAEVQGQVFQRFFSTKGPGRGLGTYGVRLLTENCLRGEVDFSSEPGQGTVFHVQLPETLDPGGPPPA
jgi:signal transduction histidine kinase